MGHGGFFSFSSWRCRSDREPNEQRDLWEMGRTVRRLARLAPALACRATSAVRRDGPVTRKTGGHREEMVSVSPCLRGVWLRAHSHRYKLPLVEGTPTARGSMRVAFISALANALKQ